MLKQNDKITYTAQGYSNAETVGVVDGYTVFVGGMMIGETATVKITYVKKSVAYGEVVEILTPSPSRVTPPCLHFGKCGGCSLMHMTYEEQLKFKTNKVANNIKKLAKLDVNVLPCVPSMLTLGYRNKLSLPVAGKPGNVKIGMYQKGSHFVVDMDDCLLGGKWSQKLTQIFRNYLNQHNIPPYNEKTFTGVVRHLVARYVDEQLLVTVVSNGEFKFDLHPLIAELQKAFPKFGLFVNINTYKNNVILGKTTQHVYGISQIVGEHFGVKFCLKPDSFFQVNNGVKDAIYQKAKDLLNVANTDVLIDCFSGIGILTNALASSNYQTYALEIVPSAVDGANQMKALNNSPNVTNICGDVNVELPKLTAEHAGKTITMVVDPPRKGLGENICNTILQADVDNIVYISCDSATLARDLAMLSAKYNVSYVEPYDMFPNTDQVETMVCLIRR